MQGTAWLGDRLRLLSRAEQFVFLALLILATLAVGWLLARFFELNPPRRITLASGPADGMYHRHAQRLKEILARSGITVEERTTEGSAENLALLQTPGGVDVALLQGGVGMSASQIEMIATLFYEPPRARHSHSPSIVMIGAIRWK